jgi:hypothetical protein
LPSLPEFTSRLRGFLQAAGEVWYGMTAYDFVVTVRRERAYLEKIFILIVFGDLLGVPILPPFYSLRLLPYVVPHVNRWRYSMLRERDLADVVGGGGESIG